MMTLAEAGELFRYWEHSPPAHLMLQTIARILGWEPLPVSVPAPSPEQLATAAPPGLSVVHGADFGMPQPLFDIEAMRQRNSARGTAAERS